MYKPKSNECVVKKIKRGQKWDEKEKEYGDEETRRNEIKERNRKRKKMKKTVNLK